MFITLRLRLWLVDPVPLPEGPPEGDALLDTIEQALAQGLHADLHQVAYLLALAQERACPENEELWERFTSLRREFVRAASERLDAENLPFVERCEQWPKRTLEVRLPHNSCLLNRLEEKYGEARTFNIFATSRAFFSSVGKMAALDRLLAA